jgi:Carboxypeptidase regulatory-like domain
MRIRPSLIATFFLATACFAQTPRTPPDTKWGTIEGTVLDDSGKPLPGATVTAYERGNRATRDVTQYDANAKGEFSIRLPEGSVWLTAEKSTEGYPYAFFAFYISPGQKFPTVTVKGGETTKDVVIRVGEKAAHLVYEAVDENGRPVSGGQFVFNRVDQDQPYSIGVLGRGDMPVPPDAPFRMTFEAKGYRPWHYGGGNWQGREGLISLKSDETLNVIIQVQREGN